MIVVEYPDSGKVGVWARSDGQGALLPRERVLAPLGGREPRSR